jgi:hypothetical protein
MLVPCWRSKACQLSLPALLLLLLAALCCQLAKSPAASHVHWYCQLQRFDLGVLLLI